jgi:uncharacterized protein (TIGR00290 family)
MREKAVLLWSGGKDSALVLHETRWAFDIVAFLTTVVEGEGRVGMHGVRTGLLERQAASLGYPLEQMALPPSAANAVYEAQVRATLDKYQAAGVTVVLCGDIFLEDVRRYREERLFPGGLRGAFPLWGQDTTALARRFLGLDFRAIACCVDTAAIDQGFAGRRYDAAFLADLPPGADPCGENGEFHTFVVDGPGFSHPVPVTFGEHFSRDGRFWYCDLLPLP